MDAPTVPTLSTESVVPTERPKKEKKARKAKVKKERKIKKNQIKEPVDPANIEETFTIVPGQQEMSVPVDEETCSEKPAGSPFTPTCETPSSVYDGVCEWTPIFQNLRFTDPQPDPEPLVLTQLCAIQHLATTSTVEEKENYLFILCHHCARVIVITLPASGDPFTISKSSSGGTSSSMALSTCRFCLTARLDKPIRANFGIDQQILHSITATSEIRFSAQIIASTNAYKAARMIAVRSVKIIEQEGGGIAYAPITTISSEMTPECRVAGVRVSRLDGWVDKGEIISKAQLVEPSLPGAFF